MIYEKLNIHPALRNVSLLEFKSKILAAQTLAKLNNFIFCFALSA